MHSKVTWLEAELAWLRQEASLHWQTCATTKQLSVHFHTIVLHTRCMRNCCRWIPGSFLKVARQRDPQTNQTEHDRDLDPDRPPDAQLDIVTDLNRHTNDAISHVHRSKPTSKVGCKQFWLEGDMKYHFSNCSLGILLYYSNAKKAPPTIVRRI